MKKPLSLLAILLAASGLCLVSCSDKQTPPDPVAAPAVSGESEVTVLSLGKADAILLYTENHTVLIDAGNRGDGKTVLAELEAHGVTGLDYFFITHFDKDHVGGAVKVLNNIPVGQIVTPNYTGSGTAYERYTNCLAENGLKAKRLSSELHLILDDILLEVYPPKRASYKETDNDYSLVISVTHGENTFLFPGDAEKTRLAELADQLDLAHTFLKVPHHGKAEENSAAFFAAVSPSVAVVTDSAIEPADESVLAALKALDCETFSTVNGAVTVISNGKTLAVTQKTEETP